MLPWPLPEPAQGLLPGVMFGLWTPHSQPKMQWLGLQARTTLYSAVTALGWGPDWGPSHLQTRRGLLLREWEQRVFGSLTGKPEVREWRGIHVESSAGWGHQMSHSLGCLTHFWVGPPITWRAFYTSPRFFGRYGRCSLFLISTNCKWNLGLRTA